MSTRIFVDENGVPKGLVVDGVNLPNVTSVQVILRPATRPVIAVEFSDVVDFKYPEGHEPDDQKLDQPLTLGQTD